MGLDPIASSGSANDPSPAPVCAGRPPGGRLPTGSPGPVGSYRLTRQVFLRGLGVIYLIAILSLWVQVDGLVGSHGILPLGQFLGTFRALYPHDFFWRLPTLCWLNPGDGFLHSLCGAGVVLSLAVVWGFSQAPALLGLWAIYLSLTVAGQEFLAFQWDMLLLEAGFLAIFFAPLQLTPRVSRQPEPSKVVLWLIRWLLFRLMFLSGLVKLLSGDESWRNGTAMNYHYLTQPLPTWTAYWVYWLPHWVQWLSVWSMFGIELVVPFFIFTGRRSRQIAFAAIVLLQLLITATGNFGFFNLLAIVLCVPLLDDAVWPRRLPVWPRLRRPPAPAAQAALPQSVSATTESAPSAATPAPAPHAAPGPSRLRWPPAVTVPLATVLVLLTTMAGIRRMRPVRDWPGPFESLAAWSEPFRSANGYGLFEVMTTVRHEIVIEGSDDGRTWREYEFKYKPGDVSRRPAFSTPHMPRLDWQMWFAALGDPFENDWFVEFRLKLLRGDRHALALMGGNPFPGAPPRYVRVLLYDYTYTPPDASGRWWRRRLLGKCVPPDSPKDFRQPGVSE